MLPALENLLSFCFAVLHMAQASFNSRHHDFFLIVAEIWETLVVAGHTKKCFWNSSPTHIRKFLNFYYLYLLIGRHVRNVAIER